MSVFKNNHANQRYFERVHPDTASKKDIIKAIQDPNNIQYIKRLTESRSMAYVHLPNDNIVKVILNKNKKEIVTILPWKELYFVKIAFDMKNRDVYVVDFYPDCYVETQNASTLNLVTLTKADGTKTSIPFSYNDFEQIIKTAWQLFKQNQIADVVNEALNDTSMPEEENETTEIKIIINCNSEGKNTIN